MVKKTNEASRELLGPALRKRRKVLKLSMQTVADAAGLSVGFISQVERGLASPSLSSLAGIAEVLQTPISEFLSQPSGDRGTTRKEERQAYSVQPSLISYERLSSKFDGQQLYSVIVHDAPGHRSEPISHRGEEMFYVIEGEVTIEIEGEVEVLKAGDSVHFDSRRVHSTWNATDKTASFLWCGTMDIFGEGPKPIHDRIPANAPVRIQPAGEKKYD
ncbi:cupin domain-containing protein [Pararhodobacter oceanensis]|uniref:Transcriptional regulator n=1 Tax=Pararhodobacter oceanensis TaxID=2172121 RepID=A0A2T8HQU1_9RHOB|nr:cupin domain-containing protein [Pararhodobacter oceanensis]PVH27794.1 transcriptional regulator [Pararhodobacter oceanensis]